MNQELLKKTANDPSTNSGDLEALIGKGDVLEALLAKHPNATAEMLRKLSQSKSQITCRNVVLNPNIPRDVLIGMASRFPGDFFKNPMFDWILLEDPDLIARLKKEGVLENTLKRIDCPESFLRAAAKSGNFQDRLSATMNPSLPGELLAILAEKDDLIGIFAREVVAGRRNLLTRLLDIRYPDGESCNENSVLDHILRNPNCPRSVMQFVAFNGKWTSPCKWTSPSFSTYEEYVAFNAEHTHQMSLLMNRNTPVDLLRAMTKMDGKIGEAAHHHVNLANLSDQPNLISILKQLVKDELSSLDLAAKKLWQADFIGPSQWPWLSPSIRMEVLPQFIGKSNRNEVFYSGPDTHTWSTDLSICIAINPGAPVELLEELATHEEACVRAAVGANSISPLKLLEKLALDSNADVCEAVAFNSATPVARLEALATSRFTAVRCSAARNPNTPTAILEKLAMDTYEVRAAVAWNSSASEKILKKLSSDKSIEVRLQIAINPITPTKYLEKLLNDVHYKVSQGSKMQSDARERRAMFSETRIQQKATEIMILRGFPRLQRMVFDKDWRTRLSLAGVSTSSPEMLDKLSFDDVEEIVLAVARNPNTSASTLWRLSKQKVREELALTSSTPIEIFDQYAQDNDCRIRMRVAQNPAVPFELLKKYGIFNISADILMKEYIGFALQKYSTNSEVVVELVNTLKSGGSSEFLKAQNDLLNRTPENSIAAKILGATSDGVLDEITYREPRVYAIANTGYFGLISLVASDIHPMILKRHYSSTDWRFRLAIAYNPTCPEYILNILKNDANYLVSQMARSSASKAAAQHDKMQGPADNGYIIVHESAAYPPLTTPCPNCAGIVKEDSLNYACCGVKGAATGCGFSFSRTQSGRTFKRAEVEVLLRERNSGLLRGFISKVGNPFNAAMVLRFDEAKKTCRLAFDFSKDKKPEPIVVLASMSPDAAPKRSLGACLKCGGEVHVNGTNYVCANSLVSPAQAVPSCDFKIGRTILQQAISPEQVDKLLTFGETDFLAGFISARTQKAFNAKLVWDAKADKVNFKFSA